MTLSKAQKKYVHAACIGGVSGGLAYLSALIVGAPFPGWRALALGILTSVVSRGAGKVLDAMQTTDSPNT